MRLLIVSILFSAVACSKWPEGTAIVRQLSENHCADIPQTSGWFFYADTVRRGAWAIDIDRKSPAKEFLPARDGYFTIQEALGCTRQVSLWNVESTEDGFTATLDARPMGKQKCTCRSSSRVEAKFIDGYWVRQFSGETAAQLAWR